MASDPPTKKIKLSDPSESSNPTSSDNPEGGTETQYDMSFTFRPVFILKTQIEALSDTIFNLSQKAVFQAGENGCEITVYHKYTGAHLFGILRLNATGLDGYQCRKPFRKMFELDWLNVIIRLADRQNPFSDVFVYVQQDSDILSFQWKNPPLNDGILSQPFTTELLDVTPEQQKFPDVTYGLEAVIPIDVFKETAFKVWMLLRERNTLPADAFDKLVGRAVVRTKLNADQVQIQVKAEEEVDKIWRNWAHWDTLERAAAMAQECLVYLATTPRKWVMVRLIVENAGEMVYLSQVDYLSDTVNELPVLGHFRSLFSARD